MDNSQATTKSMEELVPLIDETIGCGGEFKLITSGYSMQPLLGHRTDTVVLKKAQLPLKKYEVPLYKSGGGYRLHRVVGRDKDGYVLCGDSQTRLEHGVQDADIIAVMAAYIKQGRQRKSVECFSYKLYSRLRVASRPLRIVYGKILNLRKRG